MKYILIAGLIAISFFAKAQDNYLIEYMDNGFGLGFDSEIKHSSLLEFDEPLLLFANAKGFGHSSSLYVQGKKDASKYYKDYGPYAGSFFPSMVFPPAGFVSSIVISVIPPKEFNLNMPDREKEVKTNPEYFKGYYEVAKRKKKIRTWAGFATGTSFFAAGLLMLGYIHW